MFEKIDIDIKEIKEAINISRYFVDLLGKAELNKSNNNILCQINTNKLKTHIYGLNHGFFKKDK